MSHLKTPFFQISPWLLSFCFQILIFFLFFFFSSVLWAQNERHPEYDEVLNRIRKTLTYESRDNIDSLNSILKKSPDACMRVYSVYCDASIHYLLKNELDKAEIKYLECITAAKQNKPKMDELCYKSFIETSITRLFYIYRRKGDYNKALKILLKNNDVLKQSELQSFMAINQFDLGHYDKSIKEFEKYLQMVKLEESDSKISRQSTGLNQKRDLARISNAHNFIADAFVQLFKRTQNVLWLDSANIHYKRSYVIGNNFNGNTSYNGALYSLRLAKTEYYKKKYNRALSYYHLFFDHQILKENAFTYQSYCIGLAETYLALKRPDSAINYLTKLDSAYSVNPGFEEIYIASLSVYMDAYQQKGNDKNALNYAKLYMNEIKKIEHNKAKANEVMNIINIQETNKKAQKIISSKNKWVLFLSFFIFFSIILMFIIIRIYKLQIYKKQEDYRTMIRSMKEQIEFTHISVPEKEETSSKRSKYLTDIKEFERIQKKLISLEKNKEFLNPDFKLSYLAKKLKTNTSYLSSFFNFYLEKNFNQYLQEKRIDYLLDLLENEKIYHKYTVQAISEHIGYKSSSAFTKIFKKHTGMNFTFYIEKMIRK